MGFCTDRALRCLTVLLLFCSYSWAQETRKTATVTVALKDANGSVVVGAQAKFVSRTTGETKTLVTDGAGVGVLELEPATYDLKAVPIYSFRAGETRRVVIKDFDLEKALASFPVGNAGNLWPWLLRINIHIQDRAGKQIVSAAHIARLWPDSIRLPKNQ